MIRQNRNIVLAIMIAITTSLSCQKDKEDNSIPEKAIFSANINGNDVLLIESDGMTDLNTYIGWTPSLSTKTGHHDYNINTLNLNLGRLIYSDFDISNLISIHLVNHIDPSLYDNNNSLPQSVFEDIVSTGSREFTKDYNELPGIYVDWYDSEGVKWTTEEFVPIGSSTPININYVDNSFEIVRSIPQDQTGEFWKYYHYLELDFECKLYNSNGDSIFLKKGNLKGLYKIANRPTL